MLKTEKCNQANTREMKDELNTTMDRRGGTGGGDGQEGRVEGMDRRDGAGAGVRKKRILSWTSNDTKCRYTNNNHYVPTSA